jgi:hypothetical protein
MSCWNQPMSAAFVVQTSLTVEAPAILLSSPSNRTKVATAMSNSAKCETVLLGFALCALLAQQGAEAAPLTARQVSDQASAASSSEQIVERRADGTVRMNAPMQAMEALISSDGVRLNSVGAGGSAGFTWRLSGIGRGHDVEAVSAGSIVTAGDVVSLQHPELIEQFSASSDGIRQDFLLPKRPSGLDELVLELTVRDASLLSLSGGTAGAVELRMADGRLLHYQALRVADAYGKTIAAHMEVADAHRLRLIVDDTAARYPLRIDPTFTDADWSALGSGLNNTVNALAWDPLHNRLFAGLTGPGPVRQWDGNTWSAVGASMDNSVLALAWDPAGNRLYAGGGFEYVGNLRVYDIAQWDGSNWSAMGDGTFDPVYALAWDAANNRLFVGGAFNYVGGYTDGVAYWDATNSTWHTTEPPGIATGNGPVYALAWDPVDNLLYIAGEFSTIGGISANSIAQWDPSGAQSSAKWAALANGSVDAVRALVWTSSGLFVGGDGHFVIALPSDIANGVARWDGTGWQPLGTAAVNGVTMLGQAFVSALAWDAANSRLFVAGRFTTAGSISASNIAQWQGNTWSALGSGVSGDVKSLAWNAARNSLAAGGSFTAAGGSPADHVAVATTDVIFRNGFDGSGGP